MQPRSPLLFSARAEIESPTLRHDPRRTDDELARSNSSGLSGTCARLFPLYPFPACSTCVARFTLGVIHVLALFHVSPKESSFSFCTSDTDTYFHKGLDHRPNPRPAFL